MANSSKKILVIQLKMIGDVLISSIICNNLKAKYPDAQIDYLIYPFTKPVVENNPNIDTLIIFPEPARKSKIELLKFIFKLRKERYDIVIDAYSKVESCLVTMLSGANKRIGFKGKGLPFSYNVNIDFPKVPKSTDGLAIERRQKLIAAVTTEQLDLHPKIYLTKAELSTAENAIKSHSVSLESESLVMVSILGSEPSKTYPVEYMAKLIDKIADVDSVRILFNYIPNQIDQAKAIFDICQPASQHKIIFDLIGTDLRSFMAIMSYCKIIVGNDGGAINIAKALNKPSFTIFSPWIEKKSWSIFEDGVFHKGVHLNDYHPEMITTKARSELKKNYLFYYKKFIPSLLFENLKIFLNNHLKSNV